MGELATLVRYGLPVKIIVLKNNLLGMIKWEQMVFEGNPQYGVELQPIDFAGVAMSCGAAGFTIERPDEAATVLREAFSRVASCSCEETTSCYECLRTFGNQRLHGQLRRSVPRDFLARAVSRRPVGALAGSRAVAPAPARPTDEGRTVRSQRSPAGLPSACSRCQHPRSRYRGSRSRRPTSASTVAGPGAATSARTRVPTPTIRVQGASAPHRPECS